jgi:hypothetical protein
MGEVDDAVEAENQRQADGHERVERALDEAVEGVEEHIKEQTGLQGLNGRKKFFFEKKNQKTFATGPRG